MTTEIEADFAREATAAIFRRLRELKAMFGPNPDNNELADALISGCIDEGLNTRRRVVRALRTIGLDYKHVAIRLKCGTGSNPALHKWARDNEGRYTVHDTAAVTSEPTVVVRPSVDLSFMDDV